jgi:uncharacterized protein with NAD-binding domain and iron-sulfur cluster
VTDPKTGKTRVAVIGGGVSALSAIYELTNTPENRAKYDVTVYQLGWRLGGKGASGRNREQGNRIEEHGLHIWMGFYENGFSAMRGAYTDLGRTTGPIQKWTDAFHKHSYVVLEENMATGFVPWTFVFPTNTDEPGSGGELPSLLAYLEMIVEWALKFVEGHEVIMAQEHEATLPLPDFAQKVLDDALGRGPRARPPRPGWHGTVIPDGPTPEPRTAFGRALDHALTIVRSLHEDPSNHTAEQHGVLTWFVEKAMELLWYFVKGTVDTNFAVRQLWVGVNLAGSAFCGMVDDGVLFRGFDPLDRWEFREWLGNNGANETTLESGPIRGIYDLVFGYLGGDVKRGAFAAGTALRGCLRLLLTYKGALMYRMEAGMGDIVAAPFYQVLLARGVKFEFFNKVTNLHVEGPAGDQRVTRIDLTKQVELAPGIASYDPLFDVGGVPCWPSAPLYEQIKDGAALKASGIDLESNWSPRWKDATDYSLNIETDYDLIVLAASIAALRDIAPEMLQASAPLAASVAAVQTVQTQALQLWLGKTTTDLGWVRPPDTTEDPVLGAFYEPIDTWADMSDLLPRESWSGPDAPKSIAYFCGPFQDAEVIPPYSDHGFPAREMARYMELVRPFLAQQVEELWPKFDQAADIRSQYTRVNLDPTERYVLSVQKSTQFRLRAEQSGFKNVILCGDWTYNGFNAGCVEASVMSGMLASQAICGYPQTIVGWPSR